MIPTILIYECPDAPPHLRFSGRFLASNGKGHQPIAFTGPDAAELRGRMTAWWEAEAAKINRPRPVPPGRRVPSPASALPAIDPDGWLG